MKTLLICHEGALLNREVLTRWLASFSTLTGIVILREKREQIKMRIKNEWRRVGFLRLVDIALFRIYYRLFLKAKDLAWQNQWISTLQSKYPAFPDTTPICFSHSPNTKEVQAFICAHQPDILIARCKNLLKKRIFSLPTTGTFVMHPGICPEYRNSHGCFWALVNRDLGKVGMSLLRIDHGIDTGPVYGYFYADYDEAKESHVVVQDRVVFDNLDAIATTLEEIVQGKLAPIDTSDRPSAEWGQPWLTAYLKWKWAARRGNR